MRDRSYSTSPQKVIPPRLPTIVRAVHPGSLISLRPTQYLVGLFSVDVLAQRDGSLIIADEDPGVSGAGILFSTSRAAWKRSYFRSQIRSES